MVTAGFVVVWIVCVIAGAVAGYMVGYLLWQLGFELIGSAVALVGAGVGGIMMFLAVLGWWERRRRTADSG